ncbi:hypothetical protein [Endozoicomonas sp. Mp262]|uniref:hypothetical protein n=1 Tax=Endozoicomonas sp. Mp262 TaxID=2919499 RepID=UPI0021D9435D
MNEKHPPVPLERLNDDVLAILNNEERKLYNKDPLIPAKNDSEAVDCWLSEYQGSPNTHKAYKKEVERLILWALLMKQKGLSALDRTDALEYEIFLENPTPESQWTGPRKPRSHPDWKPFSGPLGHAACKHALAAIKSLFNG